MEEFSVVQVVDTLEPGGRERLVVDIANELYVRGIRSYVCETRSPGSLARELRADVGKLDLHRTVRWDIVAMARFARFVRRNRINVLHAHGRAVAQFVATVKIAFRMSSKVVFHDHHGGVTIDTKASPGMRAARFAFDACIGVNDELAGWAIARLGMSAEAVSVIRNGILLTKYAGATPLDLHAEFGFEPGMAVVVAVANIREEKDYKTLLRGVAKSRHKPALLIVGSEGRRRSVYAEQCRSLVRELGITDRVVFAGLRHDVPEILAGADVGALTSAAESGPVAIAEYVAAGVPFVATATGSITMALADEPFSRVVSIGDHEAVACGIDSLLEGPAFNPAVRERARACSEDFSLLTMVDEIEGVYRACIDR